LITAGGNYLRCWDLYRGGALLQQLDCHQKTITSVSTAIGGPAHDGARLISASLDGHVKAGPAPRKAVALPLGASVACCPSPAPPRGGPAVQIHDLSSFQLVHASKYPAPILSLAMSADGAKMAVGMADGVLAIRQRRDRASPASAEASGGRRRRYGPVALHAPVCAFCFWPACADPENMIPCCSFSCHAGMLPA
jgi:U3 small nucleolar RNA-associated protein 15